MIRNIRYKRDQRQLEEEEEIWFNEEEDFSDVPAAKPEIESYSMMKSKFSRACLSKRLISNRCCQCNVALSRQTSHREK